MTQNIVILTSVSDFNAIKSEKLFKENTKIFSFGLDVHEKLDSKNIVHEIADNLLSEKDRVNLFKKCMFFRSWQSQIPTDDFIFKGINILKIFDTNEFHSFIILFLIKFLTIKKILFNENPTTVICANSLSPIINSLNTNNFTNQFFDNKITEKFFWDKINIKYNIFGINFSFTISKKNYFKLKNSFDFITNFLSKSNLKSSEIKKKSILLLEFNTEFFSKLLNQFEDYDGNVILINQRRPAIWSKKSFDTIKNSNCKILNLQQILDDDEKKHIPLLIKNFSKLIINFFNSKIFEQFFTIDNYSFWNAIKDDLIKSYLNKLPDYINLILSANHVFHKLDIRCMVSLNEIGETEKTFLEFNNKKIPTILLEHGFNETTSETELYHKSELTEFNDKIAVWGSMQFEHLKTKFHVDPDKILVTGSPRHDEYFNSRVKKKFSKKITVLLAPNPITDFSGLSNTKLELKFKNIIFEIIKILKEFDNVEIIVKLHQIQLQHNQKIKSMILELDEKIKIFSSESVINIINKSDFVIVVSPEKFGTSTMLMESMILGKPTMNIVLDDILPKFPHVLRGSVLTICNKDNLKIYLEKFLLNKDFQNELIMNADNFLNDFLENHFDSSEKFASLLKSY